MEDFKYDDKDFGDLTIPEITGILTTACDDGEWHTPFIQDIRIHTQSRVAIYGTCNLSLHNRYHDMQHWFNINGDTVSIWKEEYVRGRANKCLQRVIHNITLLGSIIGTLKANQALDKTKH